MAAEQRYYRPATTSPQIRILDKCVRILKAEAKSRKERELNEKTVTLNIPSGLYAKLEKLVAESNSTPNDQIVTIVEEALKRKAWLRDLEELQNEIGQDKNLDTELDQEELIEKLRKARREIFEAEYAHLYR